MVAKQLDIGVLLGIKRNFLLVFQLFIVSSKEAEAVQNPWEVL